MPWYFEGLGNIGEAANQISRQTKSEFKELDWQMVIAARHVYAHDYFKIDWEKVWDSINTIDFEGMSKSAGEIVEIIKSRLSL